MRGRDFPFGHPPSIFDWEEEDAYLGREGVLLLDTEGRVLQVDTAPLKRG